MKLQKKTKIFIVFGVISMVAIGLFQNATLPAQSLTATANPCSQTKLAEVLESATDSKPSVSVNCFLELRATDLVTKQIIIWGADANGTKIMCNGATLAPTKGQNPIAVLSRKIQNETQAPPAGKWSSPYDIKISGCKAIGSIVVAGIPNNNGPGLFLNSSRYDNNHTKRAQDNAPSNITFDSMDLWANGDSAFYVAPGSTRVTLKNSRLRGFSYGPALYLDAETAYNTIQNNIFEVETTRPGKSILGGLITIPTSLYDNSREIMSIDGSAYNKIIGNYFAQLDEGGIYIYRNCGEGGVIRHQTPHDNQIINNIFYYNKYSGDKPSIFISSRNGNKSFCGDDAGYPYGSSKSDLDYATSTAVVGNRIYKFHPNSMVWDNSYTLFNEVCYLNRYPDVVAGWTSLGQSAISHWNQYGKYENRIPSCDNIYSMYMKSNVTVPVGGLAPRQFSPCFEARRVYEHNSSRVVRGGATFTCTDGVWVSPLKGYLNLIQDSNGQYALKGWACLKDISKSISVDLYLGGPAGIGTFLRRLDANIATNANIDTQCGTTGIAHSFSYTLTVEEYIAHKGKNIFVHGVSGVPGVPNDIIRGSGIKIP